MAPAGPPVAAGRAAGCRRQTEKRQGLDQNNDDANPGHEARDNGIGCIGDVASDLQDAEEHLQRATQKDDGERFRQVTGILRNDCAHNDGHRTGRARNLRWRAAKDRGKKAGGNGAIKTGDRACARGDAESERQRQRDDGRGDATKNIALECLHVEFENRPSNGRHPRQILSLYCKRLPRNPAAGLS